MLLVLVVIVVVAISVVMIEKVQKEMLVEFQCRSKYFPPKSKEITTHELTLCNFTFTFLCNFTFKFYFASFKVD